MERWGGTCVLFPLSYPLPNLPPGHLLEELSILQEATEERSNPLSDRQVKGTVRL